MNRCTPERTCTEEQKLMLKIILELEQKRGDGEKC